MVYLIHLIRAGASRTAQYVPRAIACAFIVMVIFFTSAMVLAVRSPANMIAGVPHPAVARIIVPDGSGVAYGSGTLIDIHGQHGLVITNWHVVRDASGEVTVVFPDGFRSAARVIKVDDHWDLAVLVIWRPAVEPVPLATKVPLPGDFLTIAGYGSGNYRQASGHCTQYVAPGVNLPYEMVEVSVEARNGDSGGPIFNDRGELAGVLFGASRGTTSGSYVGRVRHFIASVIPKVNENSPALNNQAIVAMAPPAPPRQEPLEDVTRLPSLTGQHPSLATQNDFTGSNQKPIRLTTPQDRGLSPEFSGFLKPDKHPEGGSQETELAASSRTWNRLAGETWYQQAKTVFAVIGLFAVMLQLMRITSSES